MAPLSYSYINFVIENHLNIYIYIYLLTIHTYIYNRVSEKSHLGYKFHKVMA